MLLGKHIGMVRTNFSKFIPYRAFPSCSIGYFMGSQVSATVFFTIILFYFWFQLSFTSWAISSKHKSQAIFANP